MYKNKHISIGFSLIVIIVMMLGTASAILLSRVANNLDNLYQHPFSVSNAASTLNFHLVSMHRNMKDVVLAQNSQELEQAISLVEQHENEALQQFDIIFERFLGEPSQLNRSYRQFISWKPIRDEVIELSRDGHNHAASAITKGSGAEHVAELNREVGALVAFAKNKALEFHQNAKENETRALLVNLVLSLAAVFWVAALAIYIWRNLSREQKERTQRNHLIDQHIMMATLDKEGRVMDASNALCRFLGCVKEELIGKNSQFFDNSDEGPSQAVTILRLINTGIKWQGEIRYRDAQGRLYWASSSVVPNYDEHYQLTGFSNILVDITNKKLSVVDKLTSLLNRRRYDEVIVQEMRMAKRNSHELTLAIVDIDYFKKYNDHYGHPEGDLVLRKVAQVLSACMKRPNDYAFRIGGEEFALVFSRLDIHDSEEFLENIRAEVEALQIPHEHSTVCQWLTVSIGAHVVYPMQGLTDEDAYVAADKALYQAKVKRNSLMVSSSQYATIADKVACLND